MRSVLFSHVAGAFADQVGAVVLGLIAAVLEDDEQHGDAHETPKIIIVAGTERSA